MMLNKFKLKMMMMMRSRTLALLDAVVASFFSPYFYIEKSPRVSNVRHCEHNLSEPTYSSISEIKGMRCL